MLATRAQFEDFTKSVLWKELKTILLHRLSSVRDELEIVSKGSVHEQAVLDLVNKGRAEELRFVSDLPEQILNNWEEYTKEESDGK